MKAKALTKKTKKVFPSASKTLLMQAKQVNGGHSHNLESHAKYVHDEHRWRLRLRHTVNQLSLETEQRIFESLRGGHNFSRVSYTF